jgi:predicted transcriptional regulator
MISLIEAMGMKSQINYILDETDDKAIKLFTQLGMPKNLAKTLLYISQFDECKSVEIEKGANLRQPELSVSMQELRRKGWAKKRDIKKKGKGRPVHVYKLNKPLVEILENFEKEKMKEVKNLEQNIQNLKEVIKNR